MIKPCIVTRRLEERRNEMKFVVYEEKNGDAFTREFATAEEAIKAAQYDWDALSNHDKKSYDEFFVLETINPDEDAENHYDGNIVKDIKAISKMLEAAVVLMDDELREEIHMDIAPCTDEEFLEEYKKRHLEKFGEEFNF